MPTIITHAVTGAVAGKLLNMKKLPARFWVLSIILPIVPDFDVLVYRFGLPYLHVFGHRGFFHSLTFALILAVVVMLVFFRKDKILSRRWNILGLYFFGLTASHGLLDTFTNGGQGIALLSPFDLGRYFAPWRPIMVSPLGIRSFFSEWGMQTLLSEMLWVWLPLFILAVMILICRRIATKRNSGT